MNTYSNAYNNSKSDVTKKETSIIEQQHKLVVEAVKKEHGISSFSNLSEAERASYKSMILEMWNPNKGLTKAGQLFLNESKSVITPDSTEEQIQKYFKKEMLVHAKSCAQGNISNDRFAELAKTVKAEIESSYTKKIQSKLIKTWLYDLVSKEVASIIRSFKF